VNLSASSPADSTLRLKIGTRGSPLALAQAHELRRRLAAAQDCDETAFAILVFKTTGDKIQDRPLSEAGGKGLFTKELDLALRNGEIDIAVHSAKDLPTGLPDDIGILGYLPREDVRDAWISAKAAEPRGLPAGSIVGTASLRREALIKKLRPDLAVTLMRGNVETRLAKLQRGDVDATLLACAGLKRLGLIHEATALLDPEIFVPAVGQGAIGITARHDDAATAAFLAPVLDAATNTCLRAERAYLRVLDGSCRTPIGGYARLVGDELQFHGIILRPDGSQAFETRRKGPARDTERIGESAASELAAQAPPDFFKADFLKD
jgi:hydroxymethylbilane synthase